MTKAAKTFDRVTNGLWILGAACFLAPWLASELGASVPGWVLTLGRIAACIFILLGIVGFFAFRPSATQPGLRSDVNSSGSGTKNPEVGN